MRKLIYCLLLLVASSCTNIFEKTVYKVGIDPDFYSLEVNGLAPNIYAYCNELFKVISKKESLNIVFEQTSWDILERGLKEGKYHAIISASPLFSEAQDTFSHSSLFLATGPVLVVMQGSSVQSLADLNGKIVSYVFGSKSDLHLENNPKITIRTYPSTNEALRSVIEKNADGALVPNLFAQNYLNNFYGQSLKIVGESLTKAGLRLITLKDKNQTLRNFTDNALGSLRESGELEKLQTKWQLTYPRPKAHHHPLR